MQIGVIILPEYPWREAVRIWKQAEELGFDHGWTYDHLAWRTLRDDAWYGTFPMLAAAALATTKLRIGTLVATPNFRHPVSLARDAMAMDDLSAGRFVLGLGAGGTGLDEQLVGAVPLRPEQRADRFTEFIEIMNRLLTHRVTNYDGAYYRAESVVMAPGCVQHPRIPFAIAATGPRGIKIAARYARMWVTNGNPARFGRLPQGQALALARAQLQLLNDQCRSIERVPSDVIAMVNGSVIGDNPVSSADKLINFAEKCASLGFGALTVHYPRSSGVFAGDPDDFAAAVAKALPSIREL
jgi:alkanesulfonate monooxygenase SsuD/methylene tetrahydromethanopterin reductase-like flavin-dependent oxidoreductase (luciferase family)